MGFSLDNIDAIQAHLNNSPVLSEDGVPGVADAEIYMALNKNVPDRKKHPNFYHWYYFVNSFNNGLMNFWLANSKKGEKKEEKKEEKKKQEKKKVEDDEDDLFGDDDDTPAPVVVKKPEPKKPKKVVIAKSIVVFDVKIYDTETDLDQLAKKILKIQMEGLVWNNEPKKIEVAFGIFKLNIGCVIEDAKILTDDIFEPIEEWEEVQSVDMVSMQKL